MRSKTARAIGATAVLIGIVIAAIVQLRPEDKTPAEIAAPVGTVDMTTSLVKAETSFEYRVGLLSSVSTANYWEYIGEQPTAWNAYVLGPTKPALYAIDPGSNVLTPEVAGAGPVLPTRHEDGWRVRVDLGTSLSWSDGRPVTAADVVYTFETVRRLELGGDWAGSYPEEIEEMVAESPTELRIEFSSRPGLGVWPHGVGLAPIMPAHVWAGQTDGIDKAADLLRSIPMPMSPAARSRSCRSPTAVSRPWPIRDTRTRASRMSSIPFSPTKPRRSPPSRRMRSTRCSTRTVSPTREVSALAGTPGVAIERSPANSVRYLGFNLTRHPMSKPQFRQSLALLLDRGWATEAVVPDATAAYTTLSSANVSWFDETEAATDRGPLRAVPRIPGDRCHFRTGGRGLRMGDRACSSRRQFGTRPRSNHRRPAPCSPHHPDPGRRVQPGAS